MAGWNNAPVNNAGNQQSMVVFINNDDEAMTYPIAPGYTVALLNANNPNDGKLFVRSSEINGMPKPARIFAIKEITPKQQDSDSVSRAEFENLTQEIGNLTSQFQQMLATLQQATAQAPTTTKGGKKA